MALSCFTRVTGQAASDQDYDIEVTDDGGSFDPVVILPNFAKDVILTRWAP
jgi:hypothetical protein